MDGIEPPIGDGSALPFVQKLQEAGFVIQDAPKDYLIIDDTVTYHDEENHVDIVALPLDGYRLTVMVDYQNPALGSQHPGYLPDELLPILHLQEFLLLSEVEKLADAV